MEKKLDKEVLDKQHPHWENTFLNNFEIFGEVPSEPAQKAAELFKRERIKTILELGGGQGRDTVFFAQNGFQVYVLDYTDAGIEIIKQKAQAKGLSEYITAIQHDVRNPLPFDNETFDACYSHMLYWQHFIRSTWKRSSPMIGLSMISLRFPLNTLRGFMLLSGIYRLRARVMPSG